MVQTVILVVLSLLTDSLNSIGLLYACKHYNNYVAFYVL